MATMRAERRLTAIMAADIVGYSRLIEADEAGTLDAIRELRTSVIDPLLAEHAGRIVKLMGDGLLAEFGSVVDAVTCAVAVQKDLADRQADVPPERRMVLRIGINLGDVVVEGEDLLGDAVNVAARLEQLCPPGGVLISGTAYDHMKGKLGLPLDYAGEKQVKNISQPIRIYRVRMHGAKMRRPLRAVAPRMRRWLPATAAVLLALLLGGTALWWLRPETASAKPSIAVLPFDDYGEEATARLAEGLTEDIITDLARFPEFEVVARNSTERYKGNPVDARQVARDLRVSYVVKGSIQRQGGRVRVTAQLIDGKSGTHLWSSRWDRPDADVFAVQTEIAEQLTNRLGGGAGLIQETGRIEARRKRPDNLTAYELYLLGTEKLEQLSREDVEESIRFLKRAIELDPGLARAWVELANAHSVSKEYGADFETAIQASMEAARRAVELDPSDAEAHIALGNALGYRGDIARAKSEFDAALRLAPGAAEILTFYSSWAASFGDPAGGAEMADQARRLDPNYPMWAAGLYSYSYFAADRYDDALLMLERLTPDNYLRMHWVVRPGSLAVLGRKDEAKTWVDEALKRNPDLTIEAIANEPGYSEAEHERFIKTMRLAGFPPCSTPEAATQWSYRLPECLQAAGQSN